MSDFMRLVKKLERQHAAKVKLDSEIAATEAAMQTILRGRGNPQQARQRLRKPKPKGKKITAIEMPVPGKPQGGLGTTTADLLDRLRAARAAGLPSSELGAHQSAIATLSRLGHAVKLPNGNWAAASRG